jgi:hypothetical protein
MKFTTLDSTGFSLNELKVSKRKKPRKNHALEKLMHFQQRTIDELKTKIVTYSRRSYQMLLESFSKIKK